MPFKELAEVIAQSEGLNSQTSIGDRRAITGFLLTTLANHRHTRRPQRWPDTQQAQVAYIPQGGHLISTPKL